MSNSRTFRFAQQGSRYLTGNNTLSQAFAVTAGATASSLTQIGTTANPSGWRRFAYEFTTSDTTTATITISGTVTNSPVYENLSVVAVPEPVSLLSINVLGLGGLAVRRFCKPRVVRINA